MRGNFQNLEWLGLRQLTGYSAVSERTLGAWIRSPVDPLPAFHVRGKILINRNVLDGWLRVNPLEPTNSIGVDSIVNEVEQGERLGGPFPREASKENKEVSPAKPAEVRQNPQPSRNQNSPQNDSRKDVTSKGGAL